MNELVKNYTFSLILLLKMKEHCSVNEISLYNTSIDTPGLSMKEVNFLNNGIFFTANKVNTYYLLKKIINGFPKIFISRKKVFYTKFEFKKYLEKNCMCL